jgi:MFS family permease
MKLLGHPEFRQFWFASTISGTGSQLTLIAYPLLVLSIGGSAAQVGAVASAALVTRLSCRLPGGHLADLVDARRLMIAMDLTRLLAVGTVAGIAGFGEVNLAVLLVAVVVEGAATAAYTPAATIVLREIVPREQLVGGLSWLQATTGTVAMIGPPLGGALFAVHHVVPFAVDAVSYGCSATLLLTLAVRREARRAASRDGRITAGLRWLRQQPEVMRVVLYASVLNLAASGAEVLVLVELRRQGTSSLAIGIVLACVGIGAITGAILAGRILTWLRGNSLYLLVGLVWTVGLVCFAGFTQAWVVGPVLVMLMLLTPATGIRLSDITVNRAPDDLLGRVSTAQGMLTSGFASTGPLLAGVLLDAAGLATSWIVLAAICVAATAIAASAPARPANRTDELAAAGDRELR